MCPRASKAVVKAAIDIYFANNNDPLTVWLTGLVDKQKVVLKVTLTLVRMVAADWSGSCVFSHYWVCTRRRQIHNVCRRF